MKVTLKESVDCCEEDHLCFKPPHDLSQNNNLIIAYRANPRIHNKLYVHCINEEGVHTTDDLSDEERLKSIGPGLSMEFTDNKTII